MDVHATRRGVYIRAPFAGFPRIPEDLVSRRPGNQRRSRARLRRGRYGYSTIPHRVTKVRWRTVMIHHGAPVKPFG